MEVHLYDGRAGTMLGLANESHPDWAGIYSRQQPNAALKLAPEDTMAALLGELDELGFMHRAAPGPPTATASVRGFLHVRRGNEDFTLAVPTSNYDPDLLGAFAQMKLLMTRYYQSVAGLQFIDNEQGHRFFEPGR